MPPKTRKKATNQAGKFTAPHGLGTILEDGQSQGPLAHAANKPAAPPVQLRQTRLQARITKQHAGNSYTAGHQGAGLVSSTEASLLEASAQPSGAPTTQTTIAGAVPIPETPRQNRKRRAASTKVDTDIIDPDSIEATVTVNEDEIQHDDGRKKKRQKRQTIAVYITKPIKERSAYERTAKVPWRTSPYPSHLGPTPEQCLQVFNILEELHGPCPQPQAIPPPSLQVAGCGEVLQVIDATARTLLSSNTTFANADRAIRGLHAAIGTINKNLGLDTQKYPGLKDCLDYSRIRQMSDHDLKTAIRPAGQNEMRAAWIRRLVDGVYALNAARAEAFRNERPGNLPNVPAADSLTSSQKEFEVWMFDNGILNLEYYRYLPTDVAMNELMSWSGVGVKTAACVLLFCMQAPVFAIDTHCFRLAKWLGWVPDEANENVAFAHLDARVPDQLKYALHQLFIRHGQTCLRCTEKSHKDSDGWDECVCPLEQFLARTRKDKPAPKPGKQNTTEESVLQGDEGMGANSVAAQKVRAEKRKRERKIQEDDEDFVPAKSARKPKRVVAPRKRARVQAEILPIEAVPNDNDRKEVLAMDLADSKVIEAIVDGIVDEVVRETTEDFWDDSSDLSEHSDGEFVDMRFD